MCKSLTVVLGAAAFCVRDSLKLPTSHEVLSHDENISVTHQHHLLGHLQSPNGL